MYKKVPKALFNSKALFNPYQYLPFGKIMEWNEDNKSYKTNGKNVLVTDEVGVGKTFEIGIILRELLHWNSDLTVLILCPIKLCENWRKELYDNFYIGAINYYQEKTFGQITILPYSYFSSRKTKSISEDIKNENEMRKVTGKEEAEEQKLSTELLSILPYDILILDEAHYIRNKGKLWRCVNSLIEESEKDESKTKIFMTGTPVFNNEGDYDNITALLSKELPTGNIQQFAITKTLQSEANCYDTLLKINVCNIPNTQEEIKQNEVEKTIIDELYTTIEKEDEDGNVKEESKYGHLTGFLKRIASSSMHSLKEFIENRDDFSLEILEYNESIEDDFDEDEVDLNDLEKELAKWKPNEDSNNLKTELAKWKPNNDRKFITLKELIDSKFDKNKNKKAIIFSCLLNTCKYLEDRLKKYYHVYMITGETSAKYVENAKLMFEKDEEPSILICSDVAKEGHNLQFCQLMIHYDLPYTPAAIAQRNGRIYRRGQEGIPEAYYMLSNQGYDLRLFGEIIVGKCQVIKTMEGKGKLSWVNILPNDAKDYTNNCIKKYIEEKLNESNKDNIIDAAKELLEKRFSEISIDDEGKKIRDENGNVCRVWNYDKAKELYNRLNTTVSDNDIEEQLSELFTAENETDGKNLQDYYKNNYDKKLREFCDNYLMEFFDVSLEPATDAFIAACKAIVGENGNSFCHDMINGNMTIWDYKQQFNPLKEWEKEESENGK